jgi:hypothetical protein
MAADDCDNRDYVKALGRDLVEATSDFEVITLSVPDDLVAGGSDNEYQYEFRLWGLHEAVFHAFRRGQYLELRFAHRKKFSAASDKWMSMDAQRGPVYQAYVDWQIGL